MKSFFLLLLIGPLTACVRASDTDRSIRSQADVDRYNATVSTEGEKLVCKREVVVGSNLPKFACMTVNQRDRMAREASDTVNTIQSGQ